MRHVSSAPAQRAGERWLLNIGAVLGSLCLILAALTFVFGLKPLIFTSGSMGPAIPTGSLGLAVSTPVDQVLPGQVVSVVTSDGTRITHRVVSASPEAGLVLKGDANPIADLQPYQVQTVDRLLFSMPGLGYVVSWFSSPWVFFLGGLLCAYLLYAAFFRRPNEAPRGRDDAEPGSGRRALHGTGAALTALALVAGLGINAGVAPTHAAFTGSATANAAVRALTLTSVSGPLACKTTGILLTSAEISWTAPDLPTGARYAMRLTRADGVQRYLDVPATTSGVVFTAGLNLLGLLTSGGNQTLPVKLFVVYTTDGLAVTSTGDNIGWTTPVETSPGRTIVYHPGLLLAQSFSCT